MYDSTLQRERRLRIFKYVAVFFVFVIMVLIVLLNHQHHALERSSSSSDQISQAKIPLIIVTTPAPSPPFRIDPLVDSRLDWIASSRKAAQGSILHHHTNGNPSSIYWSVVVVPGNNNNHDHRQTSHSDVAARDYSRKPWDTPRNGVRMLEITSAGLTNKIKRHYQMSMDPSKKKDGVVHFLSGSSSSSSKSGGNSGTVSVRSPVAVDNAARFARKKIASVFGVSRHDLGMKWVARIDALQSNPIEYTKRVIKDFIKQAQAEAQKTHPGHGKEADEDDEEDEIVKKGDVLGMFIGPLHEVYHDPDENSNAKQRDDNVGLIVYFRNADLTFVEPRGKVLKSLLKEMKNRGWFRHAEVERQHRSSDGQDDHGEEHYSTGKSKKNPHFLFWINFLIVK